MRAAAAAEVDRLAGRCAAAEAEVVQLRETAVARTRKTNAEVQRAVAAAHEAHEAAMRQQVASSASSHKVCCWLAAV